VGKIDRQEVQEYVNALTGEVSPATVRNVHRVLSLVLADAVAHGNLGANPAAKVRLPRVARFEARPLTVSELGVLDATIRARCADAADLVVVLAYTGLRWGEAVALRVQDVNVVRRRLRVVRTLSEVRGRVQVGTPKTHQNRTVPLVERAYEVIARRCEGRDDDDLIFTTPSGALWRSSNFKRQADWAGATYSATGRRGVR